MFEEYAKVLEGTELLDPAAAEYGISEYAKKIQISVDPLNFMPSGEPMINVEIVDDTSQTMSEMLSDFIFSFADHVHGRDVYYELIEKDMVSLLNDLMGYESEMDFGAAINNFVSALTEEHYKNLKYVMEPVVSLKNLSKDEQVQEIVDRLYEVVPQPEGYDNLYRSAASLLKVIAELIEEDTEKIMDILLAFMDTKLMQAHYPEIMLAWMRAGDPNYTENPFTMKVPEAVRVVRINCPVNVEIYLGDKLIANVIDGISRNDSAVVGCAVNEDGEIIIHLPSDEEYNIVITATGEGEVNVTLSEFNVARSSVTRVQNYHNIPVKTGDTLELFVPVLENEEFFDEEKTGSSAEYILVGNGENEISVTDESVGENVKYYTVSAGSANKFGIVSGGGTYLEGSFAKVSASPVSGSEFEGWFANGTKVSDAAEYRFAVTEDISLEARFSETAMHKLKFGVSGKGTVHNADGEFSKGSCVAISATPAEGYVFDGWSASSGTIEDSKSESTTITVGDKDAVVTAVFTKITKGETCPECGKEVKNVAEHSASCGKDGHYFCDGKDHLLCSVEKVDGSTAKPGTSVSSGSSSSDTGSDTSSDASSDTSSGGSSDTSSDEVYYPEIVCKVCGESYPSNESHTCPDVFYPEVVCKVCGESYPSNESHTCP